MAAKRPAGRRGGSKDAAGALAFGVDEADRAVPRSRKAAPRRAAGPRPAGGKRGRAGGGKGDRRKGKRRAPLVRRILRRIAHWVVVVVLISGAGLAALVGYYWSKLPPASEWSLPARPANVRIVSADGALITNRADSSGQSLRLAEMPAYLPQAVIAIEDRRFHWHLGIDPIGLVRAFAANWQAGGVVQGGSTITQQLAKNLFLKPERTIERKIQEVILALWLEARLSKEEILELYLNRVYLGAGAYGVDAAAHRYFGKSARNVTLAEAATLAGLLKAPGHYSPILDPAASAERTQLVLAAMHEQGFISDRDTSLALSQDVKPVRDVAGGSGRYVADWVMEQVPSYVGALDRDVVVETTIDLRLQAEAARAVAETLAEDKGAHGVTQGAFVAMDPSGAVRALIGGRDYSVSPFNRAVDARRQPGSAFKPFVYLAALDAGMTPDTVRVDRPVRIGNWSPENYSRKYLGPVTLTTALAKSLNTVAAQLAVEVGPKAVAATARRLGIASPLLATPSIALGTSEVSLVELTSAFAPFANGGTGVIPHVIRRIVAVDGEVLYERSGSGPGRVVDAARVGQMNAMLAETVATGTGTRAAIAGWPVAGKTGTSQSFRDAWFIGYTGTMVAGAWFGNDNNTPTKKASGSNLPAAAWQRFMAAALAGVPVVDLPGTYRPATVPPQYFTAEAPAADPIGEAVRLQAEEDGGWQAVPPATVGSPPAEPPPAPRRKGFFGRLFGG